MTKVVVKIKTNQQVRFAQASDYPRYDTVNCIFFRTSSFSVEKNYRIISDFESFKEWMDGK